jgi:hypothetical protein
MLAIHANGAPSATAGAIDPEQIGVLFEPNGFARPPYEYVSWGSRRQYEKLLLDMDSLVEGASAGDDAMVAKIQEQAAQNLKPFWSCLKITLQDADWLRERSAYLPLLVALYKNRMESSKNSARIALTEALTHRKTTRSEMAKVALALKLGQKLFGSWVPSSLASVGLEGVRRDAVDTAAMDEGVKEPPRGAKRKARESQLDDSCQELQKARDDEFVRMHGESGLGKDVDEKAMERAMFMASKRENNQIEESVERHHEVDYGDAQLQQDDL